MTVSSGPATPLPPGAVLVHIGMHKTGTTAMQTLLSTQREALLAQGVLYPGPSADHHSPARSLTQQAVGSGGADKPPSPQLWQRLVAELAGETRRVVLSSEYFSVARGDEPARLVEDLGRGRVHVLVGVRNTTDSAVSAWQQTLKQNRIATIERWAENVLPRDGRPPNWPNFWAQWDLGAVVDRWSAAAGADNVTVVVVDRSDRDRLPATFEQLLGLRAGTLVGRESPISNRGMTAREAELFRRVNVAIRGQYDWPTYKRIVRYGVIRTVIESRAAQPDEPRPVLPAWAVEITREAGRRAADRIAASGVRVVGDLSALHAEPTPVTPPGDLDTVPTELAVLAVAAAIAAAADASAGQPPVRPLEDLPSRKLLQALGRRARLRARRTARSWRQRLA